MKILYVINSLSGGGAEVFVTQLAISMKTDWGNDVSIVTYMGVLDSKGAALKEQLNQNGIEVYDLNCKKSYSKLLVPFLLKKIYKKLKPDIVHSHLEQSDIFTAISKIGLTNSKMLFVRTIHSSVHWKRLPIWLNKSLFSLFYKNIACSDQVKENFSIASVREKMISIPNGILIKEANSSEENKFKIREKFGIPHDKAVLLVIGRFVKNKEGYTKGQDVILEAFNKCSQLKEDTFVVFLGKGPDYDHFLNSYSEIINTDYIRFEGLVDDVNDYITASDIALMPSLFEGLPITAIEVVCNGKPMICSDIEGFSPFNSSSIIKVNNTPELLAEEIVKMVEKIDYYSEEAMKNAEKFKERFDIKMVSKKYIKIYNKEVIV